jgi:hypothetical protein
MCPSPPPLPPPTSQLALDATAYACLFLLWLVALLGSQRPSWLHATSLLHVASLVVTVVVGTLRGAQSAGGIYSVLHAFGQSVIMFEVGHLIWLRGGWVARWTQAPAVPVATGPGAYRGPVLEAWAGQRRPQQREGDPHGPRSPESGARSPTATTTLLPSGGVV